MSLYLSSSTVSSQSLTLFPNYCADFCLTEPVKAPIPDKANSTNLFSLIFRGECIWAT